MKLINNIDNFLWKCINRLNVDVRYKSKVSSKAPWVYISYIPDVIYRQHNSEVMNKHQNRREMVAMVKVFKSLGYNVYVGEYHKVDKLPSITPAVVFGLEPSFEAACKKWPDALKIYYATGAYYGHQNGMVKKRTDEFNAKYHVSYPYQRLVSETERCEMADYIFQIGSKFTIDTYPEHLRDKIRIIRQSNTLISTPPILQNAHDYSNRKDYLWLGSSGTILKGLDLTIEYFKRHPEKELHVVGTADDEFKRILVVSESPNIHFYGFMNTSSAEFIAIAMKCNFMIYPSCTEGCPGSVINSMCYGLIPLVTPWAAFDDIDTIGYLVEKLDVESVEEAVGWTDRLSSDMVQALSKKCIDYARSNYNLQKFEHDMFENIKQITDNK